MSISSVFLNPHSRILSSYPHSSHRLIANTFYLPISWRKLGITICRIQADPMVNSHIQQQATTIHNPIVHIDKKEAIETYSLQEFLGDFQDIIYSPALLSVISYVMKSEDFCDEDAARSVIQQGVRKEISAALQGDRKNFSNDLLAWIHKVLCSKVFFRIIRTFPYSVPPNKHSELLGARIRKSMRYTRS